MKAKKTAIMLISIFLLSILLVIVLFFIVLNSKDTEKIGTNTIEDKNTNETNENANDNIISNQNEIQNEIQNETESGTGFDFDPESGVDIFSEEQLEEMRRDGIYDEVQENGTRVEQTEDINSIELEVKDLPDEVIENVVDREAVIYELKKYLYENPQIKATEALYTGYKLVNQENRINDNVCFK